MESSTRKEFVRIPYDLYVSSQDFAQMEQGEEGMGYVSIHDLTDQESYELISKYAFQPAIQIDDNSYKVTFINK